MRAAGGRWQRHARPAGEASRLVRPYAMTGGRTRTLHAEGLVSLHRPTSPAGRPDLALLERVLYGLRTI